MVELGNVSVRFVNPFLTPLLPQNFALAPSFPNIFSNHIISYLRIHAAQTYLLFIFYFSSLISFLSSTHPIRSFYARLKQFSSQLSGDSFLSIIVILYSF